MKYEHFDIKFLKNEGSHYKRPQVFKYFEKQIPFNNRESYLQWKQEWKEAYKQLSSDIREAKIMRKPKNSPIYWDYASRARMGRDIARHMMEMRMEAKDISIKMRAERLAAQK